MYIQMHTYLEMYLPTFHWFLDVYIYIYTIPILIRKFRAWKLWLKKTLRSRNLGPKSPVPGPSSPSKGPSRTVTESMMEPGRAGVQQWMTKGSSPFKMTTTFRGLNKVGVVFLPHRPEISDVLFCGWDTQKNNRSCCWISWMDANLKVATLLPHIELGWFIASGCAFHFSKNLFK